MKNSKSQQHYNQRLKSLGFRKRKPISGAAPSFPNSTQPSNSQNDFLENMNQVENEIEDYWRSRNEANLGGHESSSNSLN